MRANPWTHALRTGPVWLALGILMIGCSESPAPIAELSGQTMGTSYSIKLSPAPDEDRAVLPWTSVFTTRQPWPETE